MDKLPSRHAISEVMTWISLMENVIQKDEENIQNSVGYKAIHEYLQKYKVMELFSNFSYFKILLSKRTQIMDIRFWSICFIHSDQRGVQG